jgi:hypothetical protein
MQGEPASYGPRFCESSVNYSLPNEKYRQPGGCCTDRPVESSNEILTTQCFLQFRALTKPVPDWRQPPTLAS